METKEMIARIDKLFLDLQAATNDELWLLSVWPSWLRNIPGAQLIELAEHYQCEAKEFYYEFGVIVKVGNIHIQATTELADRPNQKVGAIEKLRELLAEQAQPSAADILLDTL